MSKLKIVKNKLYYGRYKVDWINISSGLSWGTILLSNDDTVDLDTEDFKVVIKFIKES